MALCDLFANRLSVLGRDVPELYEKLGWMRQFICCLDSLQTRTQSRDAIGWVRAPREELTHNLSDRRLSLCSACSARASASALIGVEAIDMAAQRTRQLHVKRLLDRRSLSTRMRQWVSEFSVALAPS